MGGLLSAGISVGGKLASFFGAKSAASKQRKWSERMSSTAYQRGMEDMRLAGLNPMLAYQQGGASSPAGSMALTPDLDFSQQMNTGKKVSGETALMRTKGAESRAATAKLGTAALVDRATATRLAQDTITSAAQANKLNKETQVLDTQIPRAKIMQSADENLLSPMLRGMVEFFNQPSGTAKEAVGWDQYKDGKPTRAYKHSDGKAFRTKGN